MLRSAPLPSPQEIHRKLSVQSPRTPKSPGVPGHEGTESDSDSNVLNSELPTLSPHPGASTTSALSVIVERRSGSESDDDDDEEEGGWRIADRSGKPKSSAEEGVIKAGYLWKKGERRKNWKKRWFVLRPAHLAYYKNSAEYKLLRLLDLADVHSCAAIALKKHPNTLGLVSPVRTFYLQAESQTEVQGWVEAIEGARQVLLATSTQSSLTAPASTVPALTAPRSITQKSPLTTSLPPLHSYVTSSESDDGSPILNISATLPEPSIVTAPPPLRTPGIPPKDPSKIVLSGYLMKCGSKRRNWRKRWFVLSGEKLLYSASHMDTKPHREFSFPQILDALEYDLPRKGNVSSPHAVSPPLLSPGVADEDEDAHRAHTFKIVTTKRTLLVCAPSEEEEIKWLGAISALIARRSGPSIPAVSGSVTQSNSEAVSATATNPVGSAIAQR